jgi:tetratricopeptide (TPR) repeat protein
LQSAGELLQAESLMLQARDLALRRGHVPGIRFVEGNLIDCDLALGRWNAAEQRAHAFLAASSEEGHYMDSIAASTLSICELARDQLDDALRDADHAIELGRKVRDPQALVPALAIGAFVYAEVADTDRATALLEEIEPVTYIAAIPVAFFAAARLELQEKFRAATSRFLRGTPWDRAADAVLDGRWPDAAREYAEMGAAGFAAFADLRAAESYAAVGRRAEANEHLSQSLQFWRSVGGSRFVREAEALLAKSA